MNRFGGGTPRCPTCDKLVYAAEQVLGPGRKIYHKPCLKCTSCSRRLDSLSLLEHNQEPYCKPCHVKNFGTRDLRSANLTPSSTPLSPPRTARTLPTTSSTDSPTSRPSIPEEAKSVGDLEDTSLDTEDSTAQEIDDIPRTSSPTASSPTKAAWVPPTYSARPLSPASTGPPLGQAAAGLNKDISPRPLKQSNTGTGIAKKTFGPSPGFEGTPRCPRCGKAVYFAEQVKASGKTWHKPCLRCTECSVLLDSTRLTEKDGIVMCRSCYSKLHGPQGSGYALLGRAG